MKMRTRVAALAATLMLVAGCSTGADAPTEDASSGVTGSAGLPESLAWDGARSQLVDSIEGKTIAYVPMSLQFDLTALWSSQFQMLFERMGATYVEDDAAGDIDAQIRMVESRINDGVDVLIIQNPDPGVFTEQVQRAHREGIYVISLNVQGTQSSDAYVGADNQGMAEDLAARMVADCKAVGKNKVAILGGYGTDSITIQADAGWIPVLEEGGMEIVSNQQTNYDPTRANQIATAVLQQHPDLCGFIVIFDVTALGAAEAVRSAGRTGEVGVYNFDASRAWCEALRNDLVTAGTAFNASGIAVAAAYQAQALLLKGNPAGTERVMGFVPHTIVDKSNIDEISGTCYGKK